MKKFNQYIRILLLGTFLLGLNPFLAPDNKVIAQSEYNSQFLTDAQLENSSSMNADQIRNFLSSKNSYFKQAIIDVDGVSFDPATVIAQAASQYKINPKVILVTLQKESSGVTSTTRPKDSTMKFLMGCVSQNTARRQIECAAERFRAYQNSQSNGGSTVSGWKVGVAKKTQDGVMVTPASKAVASQFTYTPYAGVQWGGNLNNVGGVYLFNYYWNQFGFNTDVIAPPVTPKCTVPVGSFCGEYYNGTSLSGNAVFTQNTGSINYNWGNSGPGNGIGNDNFSVRWQGSFGFDSATYTFNATSDDGINLYVDNVLQINAWKEQASTTYTKDVTLSSGNHTIKIEYFEKSGGAVAQVSWVKKLVPTYGSVWVSQSTYPTITQGGTADVWVKFKNMGNTTWYNYGSKRTLLGTLHPTTGAIDYNSPFVCSPGWAGSNRPVVMSEGSVAPGGTGTFAFRLCAPSNLSPGTYRVAVAPLVDSVSWMKPPTFVYWDVKVNAKSTPNLAQGRSTWATSQESSNYPSSRAVDGNTGTRWSSKISSTLGDQWLTVDLGSAQSINKIVIRWEAAYARDYFVGYSTSSNCSTATYSGWNYTATSRQDKTIDFSSASARCIGIKMRQRAPGMNNFSIYEIEVYKK